MPRRDGPQAWLTGVYILVSLLVSTILTTAASDEPTFEPCGSSSWSWMYNSDGLSPCEVWEWVSQLCPSEESMSDCVCNTVTYSLWAACMMCTGESAANFSTYSHNQGCAGKSSSPPSGGADIPEWASLPLKDGKTFNEQAAKHEATATGSSPTPGRTSTLSTPTPSSQGNDPLQSSSANVGGTSAQPSSQSDSTTPSSNPSSPTDAASSLPDQGAQTGSSQLSAVFDKPSESQPAALTVPDQSTTVPYTTGTSQYSQSQAGSSSADGRAQSSGSPMLTSDSAQSASRRLNLNRLGTIIGGVVGSVALLTVAVWLAFCVIRRRRLGHARRVLGTSVPLDRCRLSEGEPLNDKLPDEKGKEEDIATGSKIDLCSPGVQPPQEDLSIPGPYTGMVKLYDPDDPSTYPPPLSEILGYVPVGVPVRPSDTPEVYEVR